MKAKFVQWLIIVGLMIGGSMTSARADALITYNVKTNDKSAVVNSSYVADLSASDFNYVFAGSYSGKASNGDNYYFRFPGMAQTSAGFGATSYMEFTIDPQVAFDLSDITFNMGITSNGAMSATCTLFSSKDGYTAKLGDFVMEAAAAITAYTPSAWNLTFGDGLLSVGDDVTFRLYITKTSGAMSESNNIVRFSGLALNGIYTIPEPSTFVLMGVGVGLLGLLRCRRKY